MAQQSLHGAECAIILPEACAVGGVMAFSMRNGGHSGAPWNSLNFSTQGGDEAEHVRRNLELLGTHLGIAPEQIVFCRQVHGDAVAIAHRVPDQEPLADAVISDHVGVFPAVRTADCLPILVLDPVRRTAAAIHAGWKGTVLRITRKVIRMLVDEFGARPADLFAALGPAIGPCCYEVGDAVIKPFTRNFPEAERFIIGNSGNGRKHLDLAGANRQELLSSGIAGERIHSVGLCTSCHEGLFFSYRRDRGLTGRHMAVVGFSPTGTCPDSLPKTLHFSL
ncbi:MAG: peptidoglycan editing factor PgeF [Thermodesulfobacteriota bacterium]